jgi:hypothetical protein
MATRIKFIDLYFLYDEVDARVIKNLLEDYEIDCTLRPTRVLKDPMTSEEVSENMIAVEEDKVENAQKIIRDAIQKGIISQKGAFKR